jgi:hypothetical protein
MLRGVLPPDFVESVYNAIGCKPALILARSLTKKDYAWLYPLISTQMEIPIRVGDVKTDTKRGTYIQVISPLLQNLFWKVYPQLTDMSEDLEPRIYLHNSLERISNLWEGNKLIVDRLELIFEEE